MVENVGEIQGEDREAEDGRGSLSPDARKAHPAVPRSYRACPGQPLEDGR
jgi:hypothetical protein